MKAGKKSNSEAQRGGEAERTDRWPLVRLGDVCEVRAGDSAPQGEEFYTGGTVPFVRTSDVGIIHFGTLRETHDNLTEAAAVKLRRFKAGSILFPKSGASTYLNHRVLLEIEACVASHLAVITPDAALDSLYLLYALSQVDAKALMQDSSYPALRASEIEAITLPLPPLATQRAIVERLDSALARAGALEKRFAAMAQNAELSFKASLNEEFAGRTGGTGGTSGTGGSSDSRSSSTSRNPSDTSKPWPLVRLGDVCETITDGDHQPPPQVERGIPFLVIANVVKGKLCFEKTRFVPEEYFASIPDFKKPSVGDVLLTVTGSFGIPVLVDEKRSFCFQRHIALLRSRKIDSRFLVLLLASPQSFAYFSSIATGTAQKTVSLSALRKMQIPLPPLPVQRAIVSRLDAARKRADGIAMLARQAAEAAANLRKALLKEAFE